MNPESPADRQNKIKELLDEIKGAFDDLFKQETFSNELLTAARRNIEASLSEIMDEKVFLLSRRKTHQNLTAKHIEFVALLKIELPDTWYIWLNPLIRKIDTFLEFYQLILNPLIDSMRNQAKIRYMTEVVATESTKFQKNFPQYAALIPLSGSPLYTSHSKPEKSDSDSNSNNDQKTAETERALSK